jgi:hypothetical protein
VIAVLVETMRSAGLDPTELELADALWLAGYITPADEQRPSEPATTTQSRAQDKASSRPRSKSPQTTRIDASGGHARAAVVAAPAHATAQWHPNAVPFRAPATRALGNAPEIARALRPLRRRVAAKRGVVYDENATVEGIARSGGDRLWLPVVRRPRERWLDLAFVIDTAESTSLWRPALDELRLLLTRMGVFRDVRTWGLVTADDPVRLVKEWNQSGKSLASARGPSELVDPAGRRLILIASDCVSHGWRSGGAQALLAAWGQRAPLALLQLLPEDFWPRTALRGSTRGSFAAPRPAATNTVLQRRSPGRSDAGLPLPVVTFDANSMGAWARVVTGAAWSWVPGVTLAATPAVARAASGPSGDLTAHERVGRFRSSASPRARNLAEILSAVPLHPPIMRLVWQTMLPGATQSTMVEVFLGGLMKRVTPPDTVVDPDEVAYEFFPGVREELQKGIASSDALEVLGHISDFVSRRAGQALDFRAAILAPGATGMNLPFASLAAPFLRRLGGRYAQIADKLEGTPGPETTPPRSRVSFNGRRVFVVGGTEKASPPLRDFSEALGHGLAERGYGLIARQARDIGGAVLEGYGKALGLGGIPDASGDALLLRPGASPEWISSGREVADAVVLIVGGDATSLAAAVARGQVVLPLGATGGAARRMLDELRRASPRKRLLNADDLRALDGPIGPKLVANVLALLDARLRPLRDPNKTSNISAANENGFWVLVDGTDRFAIQPRQREIAAALGRQLASTGFSLVTLGTQGVAHIVARAYFEILRLEGYTSGLSRIINIVPAGTNADFEWGRTLPCEGSIASAALLRADAVLFVGSSTRSGEIAAAAQNVVEVIPVIDSPFGVAVTSPSAAAEELCTTAVARLRGKLAIPQATSSPVLANLLTAAEQALDRRSLRDYNAALSLLRRLIRRSSAAKLAADTLENLLTDVRRGSHRLLGLEIEPRPSYSTLLAVLDAERSMVRRQWETRPLWLALEAVKSSLPLEDSGTGRAIAAACAVLSAELEANPGADAGGNCRSYLKELFGRGKVLQRAHALAEKARGYESLRARTPSGDERTRRMQGVVREISSRSTLPSMPEAETWFSGGLPGQRIVALGLLLAAPDAIGFSIVNEAISSPLSPFEQYTALSVAEKLLAADNLDDRELDDLRRTLESRRATGADPIAIRPNDASRWHLSGRMLDQIRSRTKRVPAATSRVGRTEAGGLGDRWRACARVRRGGSAATGYLVGPRYVVTAASFSEGDQSTSAPERAEVDVDFGGPPQRARLVAMDIDADCAMWELETPPRDVVPFVLSADVAAGARWEAFGFVGGAARGALLSGVTVGYDSHPYLLLARDQQYARTLPGVSGAPVLVDGRVTGHILGWRSEKEESFACPAHRVMAMITKHAERTQSTFVTFASFSLLRKKGGKTFDWCVFVSSEPEIVRTIRHVDYELHESFPQRHQSLDNPGSRFCLVSSGWGEFVIHISVVFHDGSVTSTNHYLELREDAWPRPGSPRLRPGSPERKIVSLLEDARTNRWRAVHTLAKGANVSTRRARELLAELAGAGICREGPFRAPGGEELWGACSVVGALPKL